jgi:hypothetical protein
MSTRDIQSFLREKYDIDISPEFVSSACKSVSAGVQEWRTRPLQAVWPILYLDALFLKVRDERRVILHKNSDMLRGFHPLADGRLADIQGFSDFIVRPTLVL